MTTPEPEGGESVNDYESSSDHTMTAPDPAAELGVQVAEIAFDRGWVEAPCDNEDILRELRARLPKENEADDPT